MKKTFGYTTRAVQMTASYPAITFVSIQVNFWIFANILLALIIYLQSRVISAATGINVSGSLTVSIVVAVILGIINGITLGIVDYHLGKRFFRNLSLGKTIVFKSATALLVLILLFLLMRFVLYEPLISPTLQLNLTEKSWEYFFYILLVYYFFMTLVISFINQVNKKYGPGVLVPLLFGRYRNPREEERIFMFMDLKSSTATAEKLGHIKYSSFIRDCFHDINKILLPFRAEVYQYVGDEIVVTWREREGLRNLSCIRFFFACREQFLAREDYYMSRYGLLPEFKAGLHSGKVSAVEIGEIKKDIAYHGDTLNTAARIQSVCNEFNRNFLVSEYMLSRIELDSSYDTEVIGSILLRGKQEKVQIVSVEARGK